MNALINEIFLFGRFKMYCRNYILGLYKSGMSFVERFIILCPYLRESTKIVGCTVYTISESTL